ncbi:MAG: S8 family peptidase [Crocinitomicaceae bacterium]
MRKLTLTVFVALFGLTVVAQDVDKKILNWYNDAKYGMHTDLAYAKLLAGKKSETVVVAVIDSGVDIEHEDLQGSIWVNEDEIPGNGIDDDNNGYIDDINGWNYLGNKEGKNINDVRLELARIYAQLKPTYEGKKYSELAPEDQEKFAYYKQIEEEINSQRKYAQGELDDLKSTTEIITEAHDKLTEKFGDHYTMEQLQEVKDDPEYGEAASNMIVFEMLGLGYHEYNEFISYFRDTLDCNYNPDIDPRGEVIGDNVSDLTDLDYGNNDVEGPDSGHGTHCAGIIVAARNNGIGNDGVADNVKIMSLRAVPNGDEWDKDIALAIRYAVDNGAKVINMSFGKAYSMYPEMVMEAIQYAEVNDVLLVHGAGNEGQDNDESANFPSPKYEGMDAKFTNWIEVGASTKYKKAKIKKGYLVQDGLAADFSNYGNEMVDVFAPGLEIYSTTPDNNYEIYDGTSMAAPMDAGLAALIKSYYPELTMVQIKEIIFESVQIVDRMTPLPGDPGQTASFDDLCEQAGIVNTYQAILLAEKK